MTNETTCEAPCVLPAKHSGKCMAADGREWLSAANKNPRQQAAVMAAIRKQLK